MAQQGNNLRLRRTRKLLREALIELIEERGFEALTVGEITARALVSFLRSQAAQDVLKRKGMDLP